MPTAMAFLYACCHLALVLLLLNLASTSAQKPETRVCRVPTNMNKGRALSCTQPWQVRNETGFYASEGTACSLVDRGHRTILTCLNGRWNKRPRKLRRVKRGSGIFSHYSNCPRDQTVTASGGKTCAVVTWSGPDGSSDRHSGGDSGDCFTDGEHEIRYEFDGFWGLAFVSGDECVFKIKATVLHCDPLPPIFPNGRRTCDGDRDNVYGAVCRHTCNTGYQLHGSSSVECRKSQAWSSPFPTCSETCSWPKNHCWPGDCSQELAKNCVCRSGFTLDATSGKRCELDTPPVMNTCQVSVIDASNTEKKSGYTGNVTDCSHQRDEVINTQPTRLTFKIGAHLHLSMGTPPRYIQRSEVGVVGTRVSVVKVALNERETHVTSERYHTSSSYNKDVDDLHPVKSGTPLECEANVTLSVNLNDGERLCVDMESFSGGFYTPKDERTQVLKHTETFRRVSTKKRVCFLYDSSKPTHCSDHGCRSEPLRLSTRVTRRPEIGVRVEGWDDPIPRGGNDSSASHIHFYRLEIHNVLTDTSPLAVESGPRQNFTHQWNASTSSSGTYDVTVPLPAEEPRLYAVLLEVHDHAGEHGNAAYARRFVLYDNSSTVDFTGWESADDETNFLWQTSVSEDICVNRKGRFLNTAMKQNNFLSAIKPDTANAITGRYEQTTGLLPVSGTDNVDGVVKFEMSWRRKGENQSPFTEVADLHRLSACLPEPLKDGETYRLWVRATDIVGHSKVASTVVHVDHTGPEVSVLGLRGRLGRHGLYVHNSTDLSAMTLAVRVSDEHSGVHTIGVSVGTSYLSDDVAHGSVGVQRLDNVTNCSGQQGPCYCPNVGPCENYDYLIHFNIIVHVNNSKGLHHRKYYITINVTNNARLRTTQHADILIDASPPSVGVVMEGLSDDDKAEMDFTSHDVTPVRWHGFLDHESGVMLYRAVLAERCLTAAEVEAAQNATEVETGTTATLRFPSEGHYYTSVVAYNGAMQPSPVACSDGITFDTTPPKLLNVSIANGRTGRAIACTTSNETWLVNSNLTKVRLSPTAACLSACSASSLRVDVDHLELTSNASLGELSDDLCGRLPLMSSEHAIVLPSDYVRLQWAGRDEESHMEEFYVGMGADRTTASAPDLLPFTPTHGHHSYHARHAGLSHGLLFYVFLQAVSKAGLQVLLTLGPVIIDVTPPDVNGPLKTEERDGYLVVTWTSDTFSDPEQPQGVDFEVSYRVGHEGGFVTPFLSLPESSQGQCLGSGSSGCVRYPVTALLPHDTQQGRSFFIQLHVTNAAGHVTSLNTSGVRLPAHTPPSHGVVMDVIRLTETAAATTATATVTTTSSATTASGVGSDITTETSENSTSSDVGNILDTTTTLPSTFTSPPLPPLVPEFSKDIDVILQREEMCIAWSGFYHAEDLPVEVGIGSSPNKDDVVNFLPVANKSPICVNASALPAYVKLFSVVKASSSGGVSVFSSDGFRIVPVHDADNVIKVFNGKGCTDRDFIGTHRLRSSDFLLDLSAITESPVHPGDSLFVRVSPFDARVTFPDAILMEKTLTGYQVVTKSSNLTASIPSSVADNTTLEVFNCRKAAEVLPVSSTGFDVSWETAGPWSSLMTMWVEIVDQTCLKMSAKKSKYVQHQCLVAADTVRSLANETRLQGDITSGHQYTASVVPCFDDGCLPSVSSKVVTYDSDPRTVAFTQAVITTQTAQQIQLVANAGVQPTIRVVTGQNHPCVFKWSVSADRYGSTTLTDWTVSQSSDCSDLEIHHAVDYDGTTGGTLYVCLQLLYPLKLDNTTCETIVRPTRLNTNVPFHIIEVACDALRNTDLGGFLHSQQLGSRLHELYDLDVDFVSSNTQLSAILTDGDQRNVTWFLMTSRRVAIDGDCAADPQCVTSETSRTGTVVFSRTGSAVQDGRSYFVCALVSSRSSAEGGQGHGTNWDTRSEVCGDGVAIDDTPPVPGTVAISNAQSGYLGNVGHVMVTWTGFSDGWLHGTPSGGHFLNYSVALGSYPGAEDIVHNVSVGQRTTWTFDRLILYPGVTCYATVKAEDRVGHVTQVSSVAVIIDTTAPTVGHLAVGTITQERFVSAKELPVHWDGVEDKESGIKHLEVCVVTEGGQVAVPFQRCQGQSTSLNASGQLTDGHAYVLLLKATNGAGLTSMTSSGRFIVDSSPPGPGVVWNCGANASTQLAYSTDVGRYPVQWTGFQDPHSGLAYFRVGLGSSAGQVDIHPFRYVGLKTSYVWRHEFDQGEKYYVTVEACNHAGLCRVTSSSSMTFDNSPPSPGHVTVGFAGHHSKFWGHNSSLSVQWVGFSDAQIGIADFWWCVGKTPEACDVIPITHAMLSRGTLTPGLALPVATPLYVTVRARNPGGLQTLSVSDSFQVDPTPPEVITRPHFVSPRDGREIVSQWDRSVLHLAWKFWDPDSTVVSHSVNIRSQLTGRLVTDTVHLAADTELTVTLRADMLLEDGDSHWAAVTACNAAGLCSSSTSRLLLTDSSPPVAGTFLSPLTWTRLTSASARLPVLALRLAWTAFSDAHSDVAAYDVTAGRVYNGEDLSGGVVRVPHDNATVTQSHELRIGAELKSGDVVYLGIRAENRLGRKGGIVSMAYSVLLDNVNGSSGTLVLIRHSCEAYYCTNECTCAATGRHCKGSLACRDLDSSDLSLASFAVHPHIGLTSTPQAYSASVKCLEGRWSLADPKSLQNISRFEWSFSLFNRSAGGGVFDAATEPAWRDVGRDMNIVYCLPGNRVLESGLSYVLHVRVWLSRDKRMAFTSEPVIIDQTPPKLMKRNTVTESDVTCKNDIDYVTTETYVTACWGGVFQDSDSPVVRYEVWVGTSLYGSDFMDRADSGLNTSLAIPTAAMEPGTRYYVSVRAWNQAGLQTTLVSDGVLIDLTPPAGGVVFPSRHYGKRHAQSSTTTLAASWHSFEDRHSGVTSYHAALYDVDDVTTPVVAYTDVGILTQFVFSGLSLTHGHRYQVSVKARDKVGLESAAVNSTHILVDTTPPGGISCSNFHLQDETTLRFSPTSSFLHDRYAGTLTADTVGPNELMKLELLAVGLDHAAGGHFETEDVKMPVYFKHAHSGKATAEHVFISPPGENQTLLLPVLVEGNYGARITAKLYRCSQPETSQKSAVTIEQISKDVISVCARVLDVESGIRSMQIGVGTTEGGLQVRPLTSVGHSGHSQFTVHVQHGSSLFASVVAENHAAQWSRFISQPVVMDRTAPVMTDVKVAVRYEGEGQVNVTSGVWVEAEWSVTDEESHVISCTCRLDGQRTSGPRYHTMGDVTAGRCQWPLEEPRHGAAVTVVITCVNRVQIQTSVTSQPAVVLLRPPDVSHVSVVPLSNNALMSPYDLCDPRFQSTNASLQFHWRGMDDRTVTKVHYRFMHELQPLTEWRPLPVLKTSAVLERGRAGGLPEGGVTVQLQAQNDRHMMSDIVSKSVVVGDNKPILTGKAATVITSTAELLLDWRNVFTGLRHDVTFSVFAGTSEGYGDVINHVTTKATSASVPSSEGFGEIFVTIQATDRNGAFAVYRAKLQV